MTRAPFIALGFIALTSHAQSVAELIARGDALDAQQKSEAALNVYLQAEAMAKNDAPLLIKIAKQYGESIAHIKKEADQKRAAERALQYAKRAVALAPKSGDAHLALSICYGKLTDFVSTRTQVEYSRIIYDEALTATTLDPTLDYAWHILGRWHYGVATLSGVTRAIVKLVYGGMPAASLEEARDCFARAMKLRPDRLCHVVELGRTLAALQRTQEARVMIERGLAMASRERDDEETKARGRETLREL